MYQLNMNGHSCFCNTLADVLVALNHRPGAYDNVQVLSPTGVPMLVVRNDFGKYGVRQPGSVEDVFMSMLSEVTVAYMKPLGVVLQPYEMLPEYWSAFLAIGTAVYNVYPCFDHEQRLHRCSFFGEDGETKFGRIEYFMSLHMLERFGYGHNGPLYGPDRQSNGRHEVHVAYALADGKFVPDDVLDAYRADPAKVDSVGKWFATLLKYPEYRGRISAEKLGRLASLLRFEQPPIQLTNENASYLIGLTAHLPYDVSITQLDDFLYKEGVLKKRVLGPLAVVPDLKQAYSPFAILLREMLGQDSRAKAIKSAHEQREKYHHSLRRLEEDLELAEQRPATESFDWANRVARAIDARNITSMLAIFDCPDDANTTTKKAVHEVFGLKLLGLKAAARRSAVFTFCCYDDVKRAQYEQELVQQHFAASRAREIERVKQQAAASKWCAVGNSKLVSGAEYVDQAVAGGYNTIMTTVVGAVKQYRLYNPVKGYSLNILVKDGTLAYARLVHGLEDMRQAA